MALEFPLALREHSFGRFGNAQALMDTGVFHLPIGRLSQSNDPSAVKRAIGQTRSLDMSYPNNNAGKRALRSSAIFACGIGLVMLLLPGVPAIAKGSGLGTALKAFMGQPVPMSANTGNKGSGKAAKGTGQASASVLPTQPTTPSNYSPTTMATASYNQLTMATLPTGSMAMVSYAPTAMAQAATNPTMMSAPSASAAIIGGSSGRKRQSTTATRSWPSSGTVWPTASPAGNSLQQSSGKGPSKP